MPALILPPLRRTAADAAKFASVVHEGQTDKAGRPCVQHLYRVALKAASLAGGVQGWGPNEWDEVQQIAWLHDTIEDKKTTRSILVVEGFVRSVVRGVVDLDGNGDWEYSDFIGWLCEHCDLAVILVKLADVTDNSDPDRLALLPEADRERLTRKYAGAKEALQAAARARGWRG